MCSRINLNRKPYYMLRKNLIRMQRLCRDYGANYRKPSSTIPDRVTFWKSKGLCNDDEFSMVFLEVK